MTVLMQTIIQMLTEHEIIICKLQKITQIFHTIFFFYWKTGGDLLQIFKLSIKNFLQNGGSDLT